MFRVWTRDEAESTIVNGGLDMFFIGLACLMFLIGAVINMFYAETTLVEDVFLLFLVTIIMLLFAIYYEIKKLRSEQ